MAVSSPAQSSNSKDLLNSSAFLYQTATIRTSIQTNYKSIIDAHKQRENQLLQELESAELKYKEEFQKYLSAIEELEQLKQHTLASLSSATVDMSDFRDSIVKQFEDKISTIKIELETLNVHFEWDHNLVKKVSEIGKLEVRSDSASYSVDFDYKQKVYPLIKTCKQGDGDNQMTYARGVAVNNATHNIYIVDNAKNCVFVFTSEGTILHHFNGDARYKVKMNSPIGIAIYEDKVFISQHADHSVQIYTLEGAFIQQFGSYGTGEDNFYHPVAIAVSHLNGDIYVCDYYNNRIGIFSRDLKHKSLLGVKLLSTPRDIKLTRQGVYVLDNGNPCVHIFDYKNTLLRSIINKNGAMYKIGNAFHFFVDLACNIIMSDYSSHCINIFNKTGDFVHQIGKDCNTLYRPQGVFVDSLGRLIVVNSHNSACLQIF